MNPENYLKHQLLTDYAKEHKNLLKTLKNELKDLFKSDANEMVAGKPEEKIRNINEFFEQVFKNPSSVYQKKLVWDSLNILEESHKNIILDKFVFSGKAISGFYTYFLKAKKAENYDLKTFQSFDYAKSLSGQVLSCVNPQDVKNLSNFMQEFYFDTKFLPKWNTRLIEFLIEHNKYNLINNLLQELKNQNKTKLFYSSNSSNTEPVKININIPNIAKMDKEEQLQFLQFIEMLNNDGYIYYPLKDLLYKNWTHKTEQDKLSKLPPKDPPKPEIPLEYLSTVINSYLKRGSLFNEQSSVLNFFGDFQAQELITSEVLETLSKNPFLLEENKKRNVFSSGGYPDGMLGITLIVLNFSKPNIEEFFELLKNEKTPEEILLILNQIKNNLENKNQVKNNAIEVCNTLVEKLMLEQGLHTKENKKVKFL